MATLLTTVPRIRPSDGRPLVPPAST